MVFLTGMWKNTDKNGNLYLSGKLSGRTMCWAFKNNKKAKETDPDYYLYMSPIEKREETPQAAPQTTSEPTEPLFGGDTI